ncbi:MAG: DUF3291 domain-containing protein [Motilibacteraceae bacterium]
MLRDGTGTGTGEDRADSSIDAEEAVDVQLAQVNVSRLAAPLTSAQLAGFVAASGPVEAASTAAEGFCWRTHLVVPAGSRTHPFAWDVGDSAGMVVNLSVWASLEPLLAFVHTGPHLDALRQRRSWFLRHPEQAAAIWWVPDGHRPPLREAEERLRHLREHGPTPTAFTAARPFPAPEG